MVEEIKQSLYKNVKDKISSPFWGAFIASWLVCNWRVWYVTFFVDSDLLISANNILKIDYVNNLYQWNSFGDIIYSLGHILIFPLLSTYLIIFWLTKITKKFYIEYANYDYANKIYILEKEEQLLAARHAKLETEEKVLEKEDEVEKIKSKTQEEIWDEEFEKFKKTAHFNNFRIIKDVYYQRDRWASAIPTDIKAYCDAYGIIEMDSKNDSKINLTKKGKYFIGKYVG